MTKQLAERAKDVIDEYATIIDELTDHIDGDETDFVMRRIDYIALRDFVAASVDQGRDAVLEEAAKVCDKEAEYLDSPKCVSMGGQSITARKLAAAIRTLSTRPSTPSTDAQDAARWRMMMQIGWDSSFDAYDPDDCQRQVDAAIAKARTRGDEGAK